MRKNVFLAGALLALMAVGAFAQEYNSESDFKVKKEGNGITITKYSGKATVINIPPTIQNLPVTSIGDKAFCGSPFGIDITSVTIPDSVTSIGYSAFYIHQKLTSVTFQGTISADNFAHWAFYGDLREKYLAGGAGTYTTTAPVRDKSTWRIRTPAAATTTTPAAASATPAAAGATPTATPADLTAAPKAALAQAQAQNGGTVVQGNNLADKVEWLNVFSKSNTSYIIEVRANEKQDMRFSYAGKNGITITLKGVGANRTINGDVNVGSGATLILDSNITLAGLGIQSGAWLIMNNGIAITGGIATNGGVYMKGGTISGGGRVSVSGGTFVMEGGTISGKTSEGNGGAMLVTRGGIFSMSGGTISGNKAIYGGIDNYGAGGGVYVDGATFTMSGGTISGNTAENGGGGVSVSDRATFTMSGGTISGNSSSFGGGVSVIEGGIFTMTDGTISGNNGGGVSVGAMRSTFTMTGGTISGNTATAYEYRGGGGGVSVRGYEEKFGGIFTKTGGTITGYTGDQRTGNVVKNESGAVQNFRGHAVYAGSTESLLKIKEGTAGPGDNLSYDGTKKPPAASGAWDN